MHLHQEQHLLRAGLWAVTPAGVFLAPEAEYGVKSAHIYPEQECKLLWPVLD